MESFVKKCLEHIKETSGFYIEAGANDGILQSYTFELEKTGWRGLLIEPSLPAFNNCMEVRPDNIFYNCALVASEDIKEVIGDFNGHPMASVGGKGGNITVKSRTLNSILKELNIKDIDLFSLDVEGYELEVLKGFDINNYKPKYVIIEVCDKIKDDIFNLMKENDYVILDNLTGYNHEEFPNWDGVRNDYLFKKL
jgi:FkbM family methyltransferase